MMVEALTCIGKFLIDGIITIIEHARHIVGIVAQAN